MKLPDIMRRLVLLGGTLFTRFGTSFADPACVPHVVEVKYTNPRIAPNPTWFAYLRISRPISITIRDNHITTGIWNLTYTFDSGQAVQLCPVLTNSLNGPVTNAYEGKQLYQLKVFKSPGLAHPAGNKTRHFTLAHVEFMEEFRDLMVVEEVEKMEEKGMPVWYSDWIMEVVEGIRKNVSSFGMQPGGGMEHMEHAPGDAAMEMEGVQSEMGHMPHDMSMPDMVMPPSRKIMKRALRRRNDIETHKKKMDVATNGQWLFRYEKDGVYRTNGTQGQNYYDSGVRSQVRLKKALATINLVPVSQIPPTPMNE